MLLTESNRGHDQPVRLSQMDVKPSKFQSSDFNPAFVGLGKIKA